MTEPFRVLFWTLRGHEAVPCDRETWALGIEDATLRQVAQHEFVGYTVSTVFIGLDVNFGFGRPLLFETMVFGGPLDGACVRYSTYDEADAGHTAMLQRVLEALTQQSTPQ